MDGLVSEEKFYWGDFFVVKFFVFCNFKIPILNILNNII